MLMLLTVLACQPENTYEGIAVGNPGKPGKVSLRTAPAEGLSFDSSFGTLASLTVTDCEGQDYLLAEHVSVSLLDDTTIAVPAGEWCGLTLTPAGWLYLGAAAPSGGYADLFLAVSAVSVQNSSGFTVSEDDLLLLELGAPEWTSAAALGIDSGDAVEIKGEDNVIHNTLVDIIEAESVLYADADGDGSVTTADDAQADAQDSFASADSGAAPGSGCQAAAGGAGAWLLGLLGLALRSTAAGCRRRR